MKIELEDSDIARIAEAVKAILGGAAPAKAEEAPKAKATAKAKATESTAPKAEEKPADDAEAIKKRRGEILETKVKPIGEAKGRDKVKAIIANYAATFGEVDPKDFDSLVADLDKLAAGEAEDEDY